MNFRYLFPSAYRSKLGTNRARSPTLLIKGNSEIIFSASAQSLSIYAPLAFIQSPTESWSYTHHFFLDNIECLLAITDGVDTCLLPLGQTTHLTSPMPFQLAVYTSVSSSWLFSPDFNCVSTCAFLRLKSERSAAILSRSCDRVNS